MRDATRFRTVPFVFSALTFLASAAALLAFFALAARCAAVIVSKDLLPPIRPPLAPCSLKNWRTSNGSFFIVRHILTPLWWQASVLVVTRSQYGFYLQTDADRSRACRFVRILPDRGVAAEDDRAIFPGGALAVHITHQPIYRALGIENVKHRRGAKDTTTLVLMRRLLSLDYLIGRPTLGWLPTEADKVQQFEALGIDRAVLPYRKYGAAGKAQTRCFALKLPIAPDEHAATFVYVDPGQSTDSELGAWGVAHAPLWAALRARTFAVHVVAVGTGVEAADRAAPVLKRWTQDGDGQGAADPAGQTKADPDIRQEIARLEHAITAGNRDLLRAAGGFDTAADRLELLQQLPDGTPTTATARGAIDRFSLWPTVRLTTPEVAI